MMIGKARTAVYFLFALAILLVMASGCSKKAAKGREISLMMWGAPIEVKQMQGYVDHFESLNPGVHVNVIYVAEDYSQKVLTMCAGGSAPDVLMVSDADTGLIYTYATKGLLRPLDDFVNTSENKDWKEDIPTSGWDALRWKGHLYGVPREIDGYVMYYNKDLFDKLRVPYPDDTWTWKKAVDVAKQLRGVENGHTIRYGMDMPIDRWFACYFANGGHFYDSNGRFVFGAKKDEVFDGTMSMALNAIKEQAMPLPVSESPLGTGVSAFRTGKIAMYVDGPWTCMQLAQGSTPFKWDMCLIPAGDKGRKTEQYTVGYAITNKAKDPNDCLKLVKYLTSPEVQKDFASTGRAFPSSKKAAETWYMKDKRYKDVVHKDVPGKSLQYAVQFIRSPYGLEIRDVLKRHLEAIIIEGANVDTGVSQIYKEVTALEKP